MASVNSRPNSRPSTPNSKIPVTPESSKKLRLSILNRNTQSLNLSTASPSNSTQNDPSSSIVASSVVQTNQNHPHSITIVNHDNITQHAAFYQGFIEGTVYGLRNSFQERLSNLVHDIQQQLLHEDRCSVGSLPTVATTTSHVSSTFVVSIQSQPDNNIAYNPEHRQDQSDLPRVPTDGRPDSRQRPSPPPAICMQPLKTSTLVVPSLLQRKSALHITTHCHGLDQLGTMSSIFIQPMDGCFEFLSSFCPKFLVATRYNIFSHETLPPVFTVTQSDNHWATYFENGNDVTFSLNRNDYTHGTLETDLVLTIECTIFYSNYATFHNGTFLLRDSSSDIQLGSSEYLCANKNKPSLLVISCLTQESFLIRSKNYRQGYRDSDFLVYPYDNSSGVIQENEELEPVTAVVAVISRRIPKTVRHGGSEVYPLQERVMITFFSKIHPYTKATLMATSFVLKHDIFK